MKKAIFLLTLILCVCTSNYAQKIPQAAKDSFYVKFPEAESVKWEMENKTEYEANFKMDGKIMSAVFTKDGTLMETETDIGVNQLPQPVLDAIKLNYSEGTIIDASKIVSSDGTITYEADIKTKSKKKEVLFDEKGNILK